MTSEPHNQAFQALWEQLAATIAEVLSKTISAHSASPWTVDVTLDGHEPTPEQTLTAAAFELTGALEGDLLLLLDASASGALLASLEGTTAPTSTPNPTQSPADQWLALLRASQGVLRDGLGTHVGALELGPCRLTNAQTDQPSLASLALRASSGGMGLVYLAISPALRASLGKAALRTEASAGGHGNNGAPEPTKIERVIDVPLAVTLRFGQRHLTLREVLALGSGSLVELDRQVEEPVDLVLGDRLIARGEVVIVDGNYGLRVTEVIEGAAQRLRSAQAADPKASEALVQ